MDTCAAAAVLGHTAGNILYELGHTCSISADMLQHVVPDGRGGTVILLDFEMPQVYSRFSSPTHPSTTGQHPQHKHKCSTSTRYTPHTQLVKNPVRIQQVHITHTPCTCHTRMLIPRAPTLTPDEGSFLRGDQLKAIAVGAKWPLTSFGPSRVL